MDRAALAQSLPTRTFRIGADPISNDFVIRWLLFDSELLFFASTSPNHLFEFAQNSLLNKRNSYPACDFELRLYFKCTFHSLRKTHVLITNARLHRKNVRILRYPRKITKRNRNNTTNKPQGYSHHKSAPVHLTRGRGGPYFIKHPV